MVKELRSYEKEVEKEAAKTADMKDKGADPYDLKQQVTMLKVSFLFSTKLLTSMRPCDPAVPRLTWDYKMLYSLFTKIIKCFDIFFLKNSCSIIVRWFLNEASSLLAYNCYAIIGSV